MFDSQWKFFLTLIDNKKRKLVKYLIKTLLSFIKNQEKK